MDANSNKVKLYYNVVKDILLREWDPIGVKDVPEAKDEYDSYIPGICKLLSNQESPDRIFQYLWKIETEDMGLKANRNHVKSIAKKLAEIEFNNIQEEQWPRLRLANNRDCEKVTELVFGVLKEYNLKPDPASTDTDIKNIEQAYFEQGGTFYVLEEKDGSIIGAYGLYLIDTQICELRKMYLHESYRGKGLGKFLLEDALSKAKQIGFKRVTLETASVLKEAIGLYKSYGFIEYKPEHLSSRCDQAFMLKLE